MGDSLAYCPIWRPICQSFSAHFLKALGFDQTCLKIKDATENVKKP
jgi:hypothetical protein